MERIGLVLEYKMICIKLILGQFYFFQNDAAAVNHLGDLRNFCKALKA